MIRLASAAAILVAIPAFAQDDHFGGETRERGAHVHGAGELTVAADADGAVLAELSSAAWNLLGFERAPETDAERAALADALEALETRAAPAFSNRAGCTLQTLDIEGGPQDETADGHDHDAEHDHAHEHGHEHAHDDGADHEDFIVSWRFACQGPAAIRAVNARPIFAAFERFETLDAQFFDGARTASRELTPDRAELAIR